VTTDRTAKRVAGATALVWLPTAVLLITWAAWSGRLPARIATHWDAAGRPDGFSSSTAFCAGLLAVAALAGIAAVAVAARAAFVRGPLAATGAVAGGAAGIWLATATAASAGGPEARLGWPFLWFAAGLAWGAVVWAVAGRAGYRTVPGDRGAATEAMVLAPGERAGFSTTLRSPMILAATGAAAVLVAALAATVTTALWPVLAVPLLGGLVLGEVRVTADRRGLRLTTGVLGVPVKRIPLADITAATAGHIDPMSWGGWGYRVTPGRSALVLRAGPGLVVDLRDGRRFAVTMDDPQTPAALLNALRARAA
jgi:hypothetical protein